MITAAKENFNELKPDETFTFLMCNSYEQIGSMDRFFNRLSRYYTALVKYPKHKPSLKEFEKYESACDDFDELTEMEQQISHFIRKFNVSRDEVIRLTEVAFMQSAAMGEETADNSLQ